MSTSLASRNDNGRRARNGAPQRSAALGGGASTARPALSLSLSLSFFFLVPLGGGLPSPT